MYEVLTRCLVAEKQIAVVGNRYVHAIHSHSKLYIASHNMAIFKPIARDHMRLNSSILLDNVKKSCNVFTGAMCGLFYIPSESHGSSMGLNFA